MKYIAILGGKRYEVEVFEISPGRFEVTVNGKKALIELEKEFNIKLPKVETKAKIVKKEAKEKEVIGKAIKAPMAGILIKILKKEGEEVKEGEKVAIIEAMKMENPITSPFSGIVEKILVKEGSKVTTGEPIIVLR